MKPSSIHDRQEEQKQLLLEHLTKTPIVQIACEKSGVGRATYYRWRKDDPDFAREADASLKEGRLLVNDIAESQLMSAIRDKNMTAIIYWLKHHHASYKTKIEISGTLDTNQPLSEEQQALVQRALELAALPPLLITNHQNHD